jgi:DNA repair protein RadD
MMQDRQYQVKAENSIFEFFAKVPEPTRHPLIAMPTGTGKGVVIAKFVTKVMQQWPNQRIMGLTHVKELIAQNASKLKEIWPNAPVGIYSAGLKSKQNQYPITFGGVASVVSKVEEFGSVDLLLIDEAHLLSSKSDSMYQKIIKQLSLVNPYLRVIGFTATPYRTGAGLLTHDGLFTDLAYDITGMEEFNKLIADGYLAPLITKKTINQVDISNVSLGSDGDFNKSQLEEVFDTSDLNYKICEEMISYAHDRTSWLIFAAGIKHSEHVAEMLRSFGIPSVAVHSKMGADARDKALKDYKIGKLRCLVNNNVLTTGFDHPPIDFIGMLRPTTSTGLWVQMAGRGTRPSPETMKRNCLLLDFAGNTVRLGPINNPLIPRKKGSGSPGTAPVKICDACGCYNHATARVCEYCGYEFPRNINITANATTADILQSDAPQLEWFYVTRAIYSKHTPHNKPPVLKVTYVCGIRAFYEYVCLEHSGYSLHNAHSWWKKRMGTDVAPPTVDEAIRWTGNLKIPKKIQVWVNKKYPEIIVQEF